MKPQFFLILKMVVNMSEGLRVKELQLVFAPERIAEEVRRMAREIDAIYGDEPLVVVCVLRGAYMFFSDLVRYLHNENVELDFVRLSSYADAHTSSGQVVCSKNMETDIRGKHVLIVEDVVDSGLSMRFLLDSFMAHEAKSVRLAALVDKHERRKKNVTVDFAGFRLEKGFIVGYGMDYAERYRTLPGIYEIIPQ